MINIKMTGLNEYSAYVKTYEPQYAEIHFTLSVEIDGLWVIRENDKEKRMLHFPTDNGMIPLYGYDTMDEALRAAYMYLVK
jgi:hypothetical protein